MDFEKTQTFKNLVEALQGEALAYIKYLIYASLIGKTSKNLERQINEIAHNEKEHWKLFSKKLLGNDYTNNIYNIFDAIAGENYEATELYPRFSKIAYEEGFDDIGKLFEMIANIESTHSEKFREIMEEYEEGEEKYNIWVCSNCGYIHTEENPPNKCPVCHHPKNFFIGR